MRIGRIRSSVELSLRRSLIRTGITSTVYLNAGSLASRSVPLHGLEEFGSGRSGCFDAPVTVALRGLEGDGEGGNPGGSDGNYGRSQGLETRVLPWVWRSRDGCRSRRVRVPRITMIRKERSDLTEFAFERQTSRSSHEVKRHYCFSDFNLDFVEL